MQVAFLIINCLGATKNTASTEVTTYGWAIVTKNNAAPTSLTDANILEKRKITYKQAAAGLTLDLSDQAANCYVSYKDTKTNSYATIRFYPTRKPRYKYKAGSATINTTVVGDNLSTAAADASLNTDITWASGDHLVVSWQTAINHGNTAGQANMVIDESNYTTGTNKIPVPNPNYSAKTGQVDIKVKGVGNAVLSYIRGSTILWNYHIWVTETDPTQTHYINTGGNVNGKATASLQAGFMDRNLGALKTITSKPTAAEAFNYFGVIYQHGRPTPFSGQGIGTAVSTYTSIYTGAGTQITTGSIGGYTQNTTAVSSVKSAIENPMTYNYQSFSGYYSWFSVDISLWSDYSTKSKSIYDPCPYGYRVPINGSWTGFTKAVLTTQTVDNGSIWLNTWWPIAGLRLNNSGALVNVGNSAYYWSSTYNSTYTSYNLYFRYDGYVNPSSDGNRSNGFSVRCVQEEPQSAKPPNTRFSCFLDFALRRDSGPLSKREQGVGRNPVSAR